MNPGILGVLCGAKTKEKVLPATTLKGKPKQAVCNRWAEHDELHRQVDGKDFSLLYEWPDSECVDPDLMDAKRQELEIARVNK